MDLLETNLHDILATGDDTSGSFAIAVRVLPPYSAVASLHRHRSHIEACYVIEGSLALTREEETLMLRPGELQLLLPGEGHTCWNPTASPTRVLLIYAPGVGRAELERLVAGEPEPGGGPWDTS